MPYRSSSVGKRFEVFLLDNIAVIEGVDSDF